MSCGSRIYLQHSTVSSLPSNHLPIGSIGALLTEMSRSAGESSPARQIEVITCIGGVDGTPALNPIFALRSGIRAFQ